MDRTNLEKLATYLESGQLRAEFCMSLYSEEPADALNCGSIGCAIGHGPYAGIPKDYDENWCDYAHRVYGLDDFQSIYCFSARWSRYDPTAAGAAARIRDVLDGKDIKVPWDD